MSRISPEHRAKMVEGIRQYHEGRRPIAPTTAHPPPTGRDPFRVAEYLADKIRRPRNWRRMGATIEAGLKDPDFVLRLLRLMAELGGEIGPNSVLGGSISIQVRSNLDGSALSAVRVQVDSTAPVDGDDGLRLDAAASLDHQAALDTISRAAALPAGAPELVDGASTSTNGASTSTPEPR